MQATTLEKPAACKDMASMYLCTVARAGNVGRVPSRGPRDDPVIPALAHWGSWDWELSASKDHSPLDDDDLILSPRCTTRHRQGVQGLRLAEDCRFFRIQIFWCASVTASAHIPTLTTFAVLNQSATEADDLPSRAQNGNDEASPEAVKERAIRVPAQRYSRINQFFRCEVLL
eukprot:scaffold142082_cov32-Tisochrysis_lutea.AAC.4